MGLPFLRVFFVTLAVSGSAALAQTELRLGYQRGDFATVMIEQQLLEQALSDEVTVSWVLFTSGPPMLEALSAGSIDMARTGDIPPLFAQAGGVPFVYAGGQKAVSREALIVPADSDIQSVADLAGKQIGYATGSSANYFTVQALGTEGLTLDDIESVPLQPADARAAFQGGNLDAWAIWDPFMTAAVSELGARILLTRDDVGGEYDFYLSSRTFAEEHPDIVSTVLEQYNAAVTWAGENFEDYTALLEADTGVSQEVFATSLEGRTFFPIEPVSEDALSKQQAAADTLAELGLIPDTITVSENVWQGQAEAP